MKQHRIVIALTHAGNAFQRLQAADARAAAAAHGLDVEIVSGEGYAIEQIHRLFRFIHAPASERPAAIVAESVGEDGMARVARNAARAGIGWISLNRSPWLRSLRPDFDGLPLGSVSTDQVEVGRLQGRQVRALLPGGGRVLCVQGPLQHLASGERREGLSEVLADSSCDVTFVEGQWTQESGVRLLRNWMRLRSGGDLGVDVVACQNDDMAAGAHSALTEAVSVDPGRSHWPGTPVLGVDGLPSLGRAMVERGELTGTVVMPATAGTAVAALAAWLSHGAPVPFEQLLTPAAYPPEPSVTVPEVKDRALAPGFA